MSLSVCIEAPIVTTSTFLFPESELVTEPEEEEKEDDEDTKESKEDEEEEEEEKQGADSLSDGKLSIISDMESWGRCVVSGLHYTKNTKSNLTA